MSSWFYWGRCSNLTPTARGSKNSLSNCGQKSSSQLRRVSYDPREFRGNACEKHPKPVKSSQNPVKNAQQKTNTTSREKHPMPNAKNIIWQRTRLWPHAGTGFMIAMQVVPLLWARGRVVFWLFLSILGSSTMSTYCFGNLLPVSSLLRHLGV